MLMHESSQDHLINSHTEIRTDFALSFLPSKGAVFLVFPRSFCSRHELPYSLHMPFPSLFISPFSKHLNLGFVLGGYQVSDMDCEK